jgi:hypothetical protein
MSSDKKVVRIEQGERQRDIPDFYINSAKIIGSLYEFMFALGLKSDPDIDPEPVVTIRMSPQHAKVLAKLLLKNIRLYEEDIGQIMLPEKLKKELNIE